MEGITWEQFLREIKIIHDISNAIHDDWLLIHANDEIGGIYLRKSTTILVPKRCDSIESDDQPFEELHSSEGDELQCGSTESKELLRIEYHILYHISYAVPYLCFNAYTSSGTLLDLDGAWNIFNDDQCNYRTIEMQNVLTQMEHPILFKPFLTLHPCRTAEVLQMLPNSRNKVLSFLSSYGTAVYLEFDLKYGQLLDERLHGDNESK